ncbi:DUF4190 domain-containing protein [Novipirellula aureliae]|nr:DUF4190 domain-containing protein [Novipirellula aureliae]
MADGTLVCPSCQWREPVSNSIGDDPAMRLILPVGRSIYAIIAGYLGLFSLIVLPAPFAILFGILGLRDIKKNPHLGGKGRAIFGLVMGAIFTLLPMISIAIAVATS